jgi:hypothetical protein
MEKKVGMVVCTCHPRKGVRKHKTGGWLSRLAWAKSETLALK